MPIEAVNLIVRLTGKQENLHTVQGGIIADSDTFLRSDIPDSHKKRQKAHKKTLKKTNISFHDAKITYFSERTFACFVFFQ